MIFLRVTALFFTSIFLFSCAKQEDENTLVVGMDLSYPPFEMSDEKNEPKGVSVDIAHELGKFLERPIRIENIPFQGLIPALQTGKVDLVISSMTATEERAKAISFSNPYLNTGLCLLVSKDSNIRSIEDANQEGLTIAVKLGTTGHNYATNEISKARVLTFEKESSAVLEVMQGKVDAFIYDQMSTYRNWKRHPDSTRPILTPFKEELWAVGLPLNANALREQVNAFLAEFKNQGGFEELGDRYLAEEKKAFQELGFPFLF